MRGAQLTQKSINFRNLKAHPQWQISSEETIPTTTSKVFPQAIFKPMVTHASLLKHHETFPP